MFWEGINNYQRADSSVLWEWLLYALSMSRALIDGEPNSVQLWCIGEDSESKAAVANFVIKGIPLIANASWIWSLKES